MSYLGSLENCVSALQQCNEKLNATTTSLSALTKTFPRVATVVHCEKKYDLTTASDINKAQDIISKEAVPFLFRQVDQLENAIEVIKSTHEALHQKVEEQKSEYEKLIKEEESIGQLQAEIKDIQSIISDSQTNLLNARSAVISKERELSEFQRTQTSVKEKNAMLEEAGRLDAEIIKLRRTITEIDSETSKIPVDDQLEESGSNTDKYLVLDALRDQVAATSEILVDNSIVVFMQGALKTLELLENRVFVPWWDEGSEVQSARMHYINRLLRYFFKDEGTTIHTILSILFEHNPITIDDLRREMLSNGNSVTDLSAAVSRLVNIKAITTETTVVDGKQAVLIRLDFNFLDETVEAVEKC